MENMTLDAIEAAQERLYNLSGGDLLKRLYDTAFTMETEGAFAPFVKVWIRVLDDETERGLAP